MTRASLTLTELTVRRGGNAVVERLTATILPGRVYWVVGPNGAGKTSLLRVLAGTDPPHSGSVRRMSPDETPFLYLHSEMVLPPSSTVGDWDRLVVRLLPPGAPSERTRLWPGLDPRRRAGRLSTGERKRLLLDALLRRPGSLLLDEPYEHLSPDGKATLSELLEARAATRVVVVATNQATPRLTRDVGLRLEGGTFTRLTTAGSA